MLDKNKDLFTGVIDEDEIDHIKELLDNEDRFNDIGYFKSCEPAVENSLFLKKEKKQE